MELTNPFVPVSPMRFSGIEFYEDNDMELDDEPQDPELVNNFYMYIDGVLFNDPRDKGKEEEVHSQIREVYQDGNAFQVATERLVNINFKGGRRRPLSVTKESLAFESRSGAIQDEQGLWWTTQRHRELISKLRQIDLDNFHDVRGSYKRAGILVDCEVSEHSLPDSRDNFYNFRQFTTVAKPCLVHFQIRSLVEAINCTSVIVSDFNERSRSFEIKRWNPCTNEAEVLIGEQTLNNSFNTNIRISALAANETLVVAGSFTGDCFVYNTISEDTFQDVLTTSNNGVINACQISHDSSQVLFATNDKYLRLLDLHSGTFTTVPFDFAVNSLSLHPRNSNIRLIVGDSVQSLIFDSRVSNVDPIMTIDDHFDFGFASDWCSRDTNLIATGNQDGTMTINDVRQISKKSKEALMRFGSHMSELTRGNNSIRNVRFSPNRDVVAFSETIDNVHLVDLNSVEHMDDGYKQFGGICIENFGNICGLSFNSSQDDNGDVLSIGISDGSVGGVMQYEMDSDQKMLSLDFVL